jgi:hypothetical protein
MGLNPAYRPETVENYCNRAVPSARYVPEKFHKKSFRSKQPKLPEACSDPVHHLLEAHQGQCRRNETQVDFVYQPTSSINTRSNWTLKDKTLVLTVREGRYVSCSMIKSA